MKELASKYDHKLVEDGKYEKWVNNNYFKAGDTTKPPFSIILPPPNVTGVLHIGHTLDNTLQDIVCRFKHLRGYDVLWVPGMDHAGIATQAKVEAKLRSEGKDKYEMGRKAFLDEAWKWKEEHADVIRKQWAIMGLSLDYSHEFFTLDDKRNETVRKVFTTLYNEGYIYRKEKIINWDPVLKTALSNIEVIYKEDKGYMYYFKYYLKDSSKYIVVGTTRPETMFGDVAVVVNPKDKRYDFIKGKTLINPANGQELKVIEDSYVDIEFGTGAMKCTPAHDPNDYNLAIKHNLDFIVCINKDATMNNLAGKYEGLDRYECRKRLVEEIKANNLLDHIEEIVHQVGHSERTDTVVEPMLSKQWFVAMKKLSEDAVKMQKSKDGVEFFPPRFENTYLQWLSNIEDWCISRQLWWGHRIPAYYHKETGEVLVSYNPPKDMENYVQDEDVLDTWFSSALLPFTSLDWPNKTDDYNRYYPNSLLITGYDIIFFWVSRMMFQGVHFTGSMPFKEVLIHGLVRDEQGRKMSKSLGNGVDPLDVVDKYGADSLRLFISTNSSPGMDFRFSTTKIESSWNFLNKIWNATRFLMMNLPKDFKVKEIDDNKLTLVDKWILSRLYDTVNKVTINLEKYEFANVSSYLTNFVWNDFCSWYIEMSKLSLQDEKYQDNARQVLVYVLKQIIIMLHPFAPFITDELYSALPGGLENIYLEKWPCIDEKYKNEKIEEDMSSIVEIITLVRNVRNSESIANSIKLDISIFDKSAEKKLTKNINDNINYLIKFTNAENISILENNNFSDNGRLLPITNGELFISFKNAINVEKEIEKINNELKKVEAGIARGKAMFENENFIKKAPQFKIDVEKKNLDDYIARKQVLIKRLEELDKLK